MPERSRRDRSACNYYISGAVLSVMKLAAADGFLLPVCIPERTKSCVGVTGTTYPNVATTDRAATSQGNADDSRAHAELSKLLPFRLAILEKGEILIAGEPWRLSHNQHSCYLRDNLFNLPA
jgi:hypothetical protein